MTFLNWAMLAGLAAAAIPIIIHLLNRRKAELVDWGAMRFLLESLAARNRRIRIEEIVLMVVRCLALALLALAMALPYVTLESSVPLALVLPAILGSVICLAVAGVVWMTNPRTRWALLAASAVLLAGALGASINEKLRQDRRWSWGGVEKDVAIVIDGSMSMTLKVDGQTSFERAIQEAHAVAAACRTADGISVILAGSVPQTFISTPTADRKEVTAVLGKLVATKGSMRVLEALNAATAALAEGRNPAKKIVLITDGQSVGWDLKNEARWRHLAAGLKALPTPPQIICRALPLPERYRNVTVADLGFSRRVVGTDRPVKIDVKVMNTGSGMMKPAAVELSVDGGQPRSEIVGEIKPEAVETIQFEHRFDKPGPHLVSARVICEDDLAGDNGAERALNVLDRLPVLIIDGAPAPGTLDGASSFIEIALTPRTDESPPAAAPPAAPPGGEAEGDVQFLVQPTVVGAAEAKAVKNLGDYRLVILANVPQLPAQTALDLARFVRDGGGLLIAPGDRAQPAFYNAWTGLAGEAILPAPLRERRTLGEAPAHLALNTFNHPALALFTDPEKTDASAGLVWACWATEPNTRDPAVRVGGLLDSGDAAFIERRVGKGYVVQTAMCFDRRDTNLRTLKCFVPLVHELAAYLAAPTMLESNVQPGGEMTVELATGAAGTKTPVEKDVRALQDLLAKVGPVEVVTPSERRLPATMALGDRVLRASFTGTQEPGLYRVLVPRAVVERYGLVSDKKGTPFVVLGEVGESRLAALTDADFQEAAKEVPFVRVNSTEAMAAAVAERTLGQPIWKYLAIAVLVALVCEIALTRWIATERRTHVKQEVRFSDTGPGARTFAVGPGAMARSREPSSVAGP